MKRVLVVGAIGLLVSAWGCGSDDSSGGNGGGSGGSGGSSAGTAGTGGSGTGATGGATGGSGGATGGTGGVADAGMEASLDVYRYQPCEDVCKKVEQPCAYTPMDLEDCIQGCTAESLGDCSVELRAYVTCVNDATQVECVQGNPTSTECDTEAQAYGQCASAGQN